MELEPCPFCGGTNVIFATVPSWPKPYYELICLDCNAVLKARDKESVWALWNRRAEPPNEPLTLDELREMNRRPIWVQFLDPADADKCGWEICKYYMYDWNLYGKLWVAYRQRPGEV